MHVHTYMYICIIYMMTLSHLLPYPERTLLAQTMSGAPDMSAVSRNRHVRCVTQPTCLLCHIADMSAVSDINHVCSVTQQNLLRHRAYMSAVPYKRHAAV